MDILKITNLILSKNSVNGIQVFQQLGVKNHFFTFLNNNGTDVHCFIKMQTASEKKR